MLIELQPKTKHGKNRVQQHGSQWICTGHGEFRGRPAMTLRSIGKTMSVGGERRFDARWVHIKDDDNFDWKIVDDPDPNTMKHAFSEHASMMKKIEGGGDFHG